MTVLDITLPEPLAFVADEVARGGYGSASEHPQALIEERQKALSEAALEAQIQAGLDSPMCRVTPDDWKTTTNGSTKNSHDVVHPDNDTTPLGCIKLVDDVPRVAAARQPWAEGRNAVGVFALPRRHTRAWASPIRGVGNRSEK